LRSTSERSPGHQALADQEHTLVPEKWDRRFLLGQVAALVLADAIPDIADAASPLVQTPQDIATAPFGLPAVGMKRIFLCRHGQTEYNRLKLMQGRRVDAPINSYGEQQAELLGKAVSDQDLKLVASSSLLRARQTADAVQRQQRSQSAARLALPELDEIDFGEADGMEVRKARATMGSVYFQWIAGRKDARAPGGESFREIEERCRAGVAKLLSTCEEGGSVLAVTHSALIRCYLAVTLDLPYEKAKALSQPNCCINVLDFDRNGEVDPLYLGYTNHLPKTLITSAPTWDAETHLRLRA